MKIYPLLIPKKVILPVAILGFIFTISGTLMKISHWSIGILTPNTLLSLSIVFTFLAFFVVLIDMVKNPIKNKFLWIVPLLFLGNLVAIVYLLVRDAHLKKELYKS